MCWVLRHVELQCIIDDQVKIRTKLLKSVMIILPLDCLLFHNGEAHGLRDDGLVNGY